VLIRPAVDSDCDPIWRLYMEPSVREASTRTDYFNLDAHRIWWAGRFGDPYTRIWVAEDSEIAGAVRYGKVLDKPEAEISIAVRPEYRGRRVASDLLAKTMTLAGAALHVDRLVALVKMGNTASGRLFLGAGFQLVGREIRMGSDHWVFHKE
jgi:RimJ/RimL family protein N-acetyltransferase